MECRMPAAANHEPERRASLCWNLIALAMPLVAFFGGCAIGGAYGGHPVSVAIVAVRGYGLISLAGVCCGVIALARREHRGRGAEGERRRCERSDGVETRSVEPGAPERLHGEPADSEPDDRTDAELAREQPEHVRHVVVGPLQPLDEAEHEQHGHRVVEAGFALEGA